MINDEGYPAISGESLRIFQRWQDDPQFIFICLGRLKPTLVDQSERDLTPTFFRAQVNPLNQRRFFFWQKKGAQQRTQRRRWFCCQRPHCRRLRFAGAATLGGARINDGWDMIGYHGM
jgi:hypothetical protein